MDTAIRVLVLGASGMLGNAALRFFANSHGYEAFGSARSSRAFSNWTGALRKRIVSGVEVSNLDDVVRLFAEIRPNVVLNCIGVVKQLDAAHDPLIAVPINALLPHQLARLCEVAGARLIQVSTDCVFAGTRGSYREEDMPDAADLYGRSKFLGEVDYPNALTLRTSIIGHELDTAHGLVEWFLRETGTVRGYRRAIFSGVPTVELARVIRDYVLPRPHLRGVYHVSAAPISKFDLLELIRQTYGRNTEIVPDDEVKIDRSLDSMRFRQATGYEPPTWPELLRAMHEFQ